MNRCEGSAKFMRLMIAIVTLAATLAMFAAPPAARAQPPTETVVLQLRFHAFAADVSPNARVSGQYALLTFSSSSHVLLINDQNGRRTMITPPPGCDFADAFGRPWALFFCQDRGYTLYNIYSRAWRTFPCCDNAWYSSRALAIGAHWALFDQNAECGNHPDQPCNPDYVYVHIPDGAKVRLGSPTSTDTDLDSPSLVRNLCRPLHGPATFFGKFAVVAEATGLYLERCGSPLQMPLVTGGYAGTMMGNMNAVAFCSFDKPQQYTGIFLPSLRRFTFSASNIFRCGGVLDSGRMYSFDANERHVLTAAFPSGPSPPPTSSLPWAAITITKQPVKVRPDRRFWISGFLGSRPVDPQGGTVTLKAIRGQGKRPTVTVKRDRHKGFSARVWAGNGKVVQYRITFKAADFRSRPVNSRLIKVSK